jgi:hypothetical protein
MQSIEIEDKAVVLAQKNTHCYRGRLGSCKINVSSSTNYFDLLCLNDFIKYQNGTSSFQKKWHT